MRHVKPDHPVQPTAAGEWASPRPYEAPRVEKLGSLRDLLAAKSGPALDPGGHFPEAKN